MRQPVAVDSGELRRGADNGHHCHGRRTGRRDLRDPHFRNSAYDPQIACARSRTANSLFAVEATRRWADDGIVANAVTPVESQPGCSAPPPPWSPP